MEKRVFIGSFVNIPGFEKEYLSIKKEFGGLLGGRWVPERNFHITYRFIGNVSLNEIQKIKSVLKDQLDKKISVNLQFRGLNAFPNLANPRVFFVKVEDISGNLEEINNAISKKLSLIGYTEERKPFIPHITLKRVKYVKKEIFLKKIKIYENKLFGFQKEIKINIVESILRPDGAVYKPVE